MEGGEDGEGREEKNEEGGRVSGEGVYERSKWEDQLRIEIDEMEKGKSKCEEEMGGKVEVRREETEKMGRKIGR